MSCCGTVEGVSEPDASTAAPSCVGLDPDWIVKHVVVDGSAPSAATFGGFIGTGQMSRNARFFLEWGEGASTDSAAGRPAKPASVVVKLPSDDLGTRALSFEHRVYLNEVEFYRSLSPLLDVSVPGIFTCHFDEAAQDFAIVLEDLDQSEQGDQFTEATDEQLLLAIEQSAALQAPLWGHPEHPALVAYQVDLEARVAAAELMTPIFVDVVRERLWSGLDADVQELVEGYVRVVGDWYRLRAAPVTLVHGDFRPDNFMFGTTADAPPIAIVDWQTLALGAPAVDVSYLLGAAVSPERRREIEGEMLSYYRAALARRGVDYPEQQCRADYAIGTLHGIATAVTATTVATTTERGDALFTLMLNRHGRHAIDLGVIELLERGQLS